jgi:hypothetical protein
MHWPTDQLTAQAATAYPVVIKREAPATQFVGCPTRAETWNDRVFQPAQWPAGPLRSSPEQIIKFFRMKRYTQGLAMVVSWGGMGRRSKDIYGQRRHATIEQIERTLRECAESIQTSQSIADSWRALTGQLNWSAVITSKTLHFLCRSSGFEQNPPVAIDNSCIRDKVWPAFRNSIPSTQRPKGWNGNTLEAYYRYMTAILIWSEAKNWTTTQMESTIFCEYMS